MNAEPNPEQIDREPKPFNSVAYWIFGAFITLTIAFLIALLFPKVITSVKKSTHAEAISNAKQISLTLFKFENDYGSYPNSETAKDVTENFPNHGYDLSGKSSNAAFRQLLAAGILKNEEIIKKGKCNFAYISGQASAGNPSRILLLYPIIPGTTKFDPKPFDGNAIVLHIDQSVSTYKIGKDDHIYDKDGLDILSPKHPMWNGKAPDIRYPE